MSALGRLVIELSADTVKYASDLGKAAHISEQRARDIAKSISIATGAFTAMGAAVSALAKSSINEMDALNKMSQRVGVNVEALSGLKFAAQLADVSTESLGTGLKKLSVNMLDTQAGAGDAREAFRALGIEVKQADGSLKGADGVMREIADRFSRMEDGAGKTALAVKLFGRAGSDLIPLLNQGAAGLKSAADEADRLGLTVSTKAAKAAEDFNDNLTRLSKGASSLGIAIATEALPALVKITDQLRDAATAAGGFWKFLANPFAYGISDPGAKVIELEGNLEKLKKLRDELSTPTLTNKLNNVLFGDVGDLNLQIAATEKQLQFLRKMQEIKLERLSVDSIHRVKSGAPALSDSTTKAIRSDNLVGQQWAQWQEEEAKIMSQAAQYTDDYYRKQREEEKKLEDDRKKAMLEFIDREREREEIQMRLVAGFDAEGKAMKELKQASQDWGFNFNSAIEEAILNFKSLGDVVRSVGNDIARMILRKTIVEPLGGAVSKGVKGVIEGIFGGKGGGGGGNGGVVDPTQGSAFVGSFDSGTDYVPRTGLAMLHQGEAVIPAAENAGGRGVQNVFYVDMKGASLEAVQRLEAFVLRVNGSIERRALRAVKGAWNSRGSTTPIG